MSRPVPPASLLQEYCRLHGLRSYGTKHELQELVYQEMVAEVHPSS